MAYLAPQISKTNDGKPLEIRTPTLHEAAAVLAVGKSVIEEKVFDLLSPEDIEKSADESTEWVRSHLEEDHFLMLVAVIDQKIVGTLDFSNGPQKRISHTGNFGMAILKKYRDQGIGHELLRTLLAWAQATNHIEKVSLRVHETNKRAIALYEKFGFKIEGINRRELKYGPGDYVDVLIMAILLKSL